MQDNALSVIVCGSGAAFSVPSYLIWFRNEIDLGLRVLLTHSAERFLQAQAVAWCTDEVFMSSDPAVNPVEIAKRSLGIAVLPATANMLACAALGLATTPAQTALLASDRPSLFFPVMNSSMWGRDSVQRHVATLRADGHTVVEPPQQEVFELWRREIAIGPTLPPPEEVTETIIKWLDESPPTQALFEWLAGHAGRDPAASSKAKTVAASGMPSRTISRLVTAAETASAASADQAAA